MESIKTAAIGATLGATGTTQTPVDSSGGTSPLSDVSTLDAELFSRLLEKKGTNVQNSAVLTSAAVPLAVSNDTSNMGGSILRSLEKMGGEFRETWHDVVDVSAPTYSADPGMSMTDALRVQWHMVTIAAQYEAVGKAIGKVTQDVDQLVRMQ